MTVPLYNLTDTWNDGATVFTGLKLNVANTASDPNSLLMDLQDTNVSKLKVYSGGSTTNIIGGPYTGFVSGNTALNYHSGDVSAARISFLTSSIDDNNTFFQADAAGIIAQRNSTTSQSLRLYNTYTDASNYERGASYFDAAHDDTWVIETQASGSGTQPPLRLCGSEIWFWTPAFLGGGKWGMRSTGVFWSLGGIGIGDADHPATDPGLQNAGSGVFKFTAPGSFSSNGSVATVLGSIGPAGSHTTVQTWLTIADDGGVIRYIPCF